MLRAGLTSAVAAEYKHKILSDDCPAWAGHMVINQDVQAPDYND
jgi:hypothetical protein